jgi:hypothetical protein
MATDNLELASELERMKVRLRDLMFITSGMFEIPAHDAEECLIRYMQNILDDLSLEPHRDMEGWNPTQQKLIGRG